jgi:hypothetical protein
MRIDEVAKNDHAMKNWKSVKQVQAFLKREGYKRLGKGAFAEAWSQRGSDTVIKISTVEDVCWLRYAKWAKTQQDNPHVPKISMLKTYKTKDGTLFVARVEKLSEVDHYFDKILTQIGREQDPKKVGEMLWIGLLGYDTVQDLLKESNIVRSLANSTVKKTYYPHFTVPEMIAHVLSGARRTKLAQTVKHAHAHIMKDPRCYEDLHSGNIMMRDDGTVVIMDPAAMYMTSIGSY